MTTQQIKGVKISDKIRESIENRLCCSLDDLPAASLKARWESDKQQRDLDDLNKSLLAAQGYNDMDISLAGKKAKDQSRPVLICLTVGGSVQRYFTAYVVSIKPKIRETIVVTPTNADNERPTKKVKPLLPATVELQEVRKTQSVELTDDVKAFIGKAIADCMTSFLTEQAKSKKK